MRQFLLYVHTGRESALDALSQVAKDLYSAGVRPLLTDQQVQEIESADPAIVPQKLRDQLAAGQITTVDMHAVPPTTELCIVLGGDGTILRALELIREHDIPVHGVNLGHVGFLAESEAEDLGATVSRLLNRDYAIESRSALEAHVYDETDQLVGKHWALNEASLEKADRHHMIYVVLGIDGRPVSEFGCDGVLLSSSTGSTAYAFSAGGPVMWPEVDAMLVVPLAAHALFARPLVLGRSSEIEVEISLESPSAAILNLDGRRHVELARGSRIEAHLSDRSVHFARFAETPFADRLVKKFQLPVEGWRGRGPHIRRDNSAEVQ